MYHRQLNQQGLQVRFSASFDNIDAVCSDVELLLVQQSLNEHLFEVLLGARECLNNAVKHGSQLDETKEVAFQIRLLNQELVLIVTDEGDGFDHREALLQCDISAESGRGICILNNYYEDVCYNHKGNEVVLKRKLGKFLPSTMEINMNEIRIEDNKATMIIEGDIVSSVVDDLKKELKNALDSGISHLTLDLDQVTYIDSMGIGLLVATHNSLKKTDSTLELTHVSEEIKKLMNLMRLDQHLQIS